MPKALATWIASIFFLLAMVGTAGAQFASGSISGAVRDSTGAVIPGAKVTITNTATNAVRSVTGNGEGLYSAPALEPGQYRVYCEQMGFQTVESPAVVQAGSSTTVNFPLSSDTVSQEVKVIQRYVDEGSSWMPSKKEAGGGGLINLGDHGFDLCYSITGQTPQVLSAVTNHSFFNLDIEDCAFVTTRAPNGMVFLNEAGYSFPTRGSDSENTIAAKKARIRSAGFNGVEVIGPGVHQQLKPPAGYKSLWVGAVADAIDRLGRGEPPAVTARDLARAISLVLDSYKVAGEAT